MSPSEKAQEELHQEMQVEYGQWWSEMKDTQPGWVDLLDDRFQGPGEIRRGLNGPDDERLFELNLAAMKTLMDSTQEDMDALSIWQVSYEMIRAGLVDGRAGLNKLDYLVRTCADPDNPGNVHPNTLDRYEDMLKRRVSELDRVFSNLEEGGRRRVLYRSFRVPSGDVGGYVNSHYRLGDVVEEKSYLSTSADSDYMLTYNNHLNHQQFVFEILTDRGVTLHNPVHEHEGSVDFMEREVLLPRGLKFKVVGVHKNVKYELSDPSFLGRRQRKPLSESKFWVVQLEQI